MQAILNSDFHLDRIIAIWRHSEWMYPDIFFFINICHSSWYQYPYKISRWAISLPRPAREVERHTWAWRWSPDSSHIASPHSWNWIRMSAPAAFPLVLPAPVTKTGIHGDVLDHRKALSSNIGGLFCKVERLAHTDATNKLDFDPLMNYFLPITYMYRNLRRSPMGPHQISQVCTDRPCDWITIVVHWTRYYFLFLRLHLNLFACIFSFQFNIYINWWRKEERCHWSGSISTGKM